MTEIRYQSNGDYWQIVYRDSNGRKIVKSAGSKAKISEAAVKRRCLKLAAEFLARPGARDTGKSPRLSTWEARYFELRSARLSEGTIALHKDTFARLREHFGDIRLHQITAASAASWAAWLRTSALSRQQPKHGEAPATIGEATASRHLRDAHVIFRTAMRMHLIPFNPFSEVDRGCSVVSTWKYIGRADFAKVLAACPCPGYRALFALCRYAGLRLGEALRLTWDDLDMSGRYLTIVPPANARGDRVENTKKRLRHVPVDMDLHAVLLGTERTSERVCDISINNLHRNAVAIIKAAGLPEYRKPYHTLKKCLASEWLSQGIPVTDVAQWLGDSVAVLERHYTRWLQSSAHRVTGKRDELQELRSREASLLARIRELEEATKKNQENNTLPLADQPPPG